MKVVSIKSASKFFLFFLFSSLMLTGCRPISRSPETNQPQPGTGSIYPVLLGQDETRRERALETWNTITRAQGISNAPAPTLHPVTGAIVSLPQPSNQPFLLPKVGEGVPMREDEIRESLRRFLKDGGALLCGSSPQQLSLTERTDETDGTKRAVYQQQIFRYPLRGDFGKIEIVFKASRQIIGIKSMCLPYSENLQRMISELRPNSEITPESLVAKIKGQTVTIKNEDGSATVETITVNNENEINVQELVVYSQETTSNSTGIELHLAWAVKLSNKAMAYYDAQTGNLLAATAIRVLSSVTSN